MDYQIPGGADPYPAYPSFQSPNWAEVYFKNASRWVRRHQNYEEFINECKAAFPIFYETEICLKHNGYEISNIEFFDYIQFHPNATFIIEEKISIRDAPMTQSLQNDFPSVSQVNRDQLKSFLKKRKFDVDVFNKQELVPKDRRKLMRLTGSYLFQKTKDKPLQKDIVQVSKDLVELFPDLRDRDTVEGIELVFDTKTGGGFLGNRIKFQKKLLKEEEKRLKELELASTSTDSTASAEPKKLVAVVKDAKEISEYLKNPEKIILAFKSCYGQENSIFDIWPKLSEGTAKAFKTFNIPLDIPWVDKDLITLMKLVSLLPSTHRNKKNEKKIKVSESYQRLFLFRKNSIPIDDIIKKTEERDAITGPLIICTGESENDKNLIFNVLIDQVCLPESDSALEAFDLLFKSHFVFETLFDKGLVSFFCFVQKYVYKIDEAEVKATPTMKLVRNAINI